MSKEIKITVTDETDACEIIELAVEEIELLTKAFNMITDVLEARSQSEIVAEEIADEKVLVH